MEHELRKVGTSVAAVGQNRVNPSEYFSPSAQPTSIRPAARSAAHVVIVSIIALLHCDGCSLRNHGMLFVSALQHGTTRFGFC
jgi:hypothetical protein